ncbi:MAG: hypothetical protein JOZ67_07070 [Gammaproteobacteria bacterium]|nr:hypothetical protein [Gammaproteobacteria bacterium]MBV9696212.1 hypothetical protein [Gammaproteobacteria bacterium]
MLSAWLAAAPLAAAPSATPVKRGARACHKEADNRHLSGAARVQFLKQCHAPKRAAPAP